MTTMFVAVSTYLKPLEDIDGTRHLHLRWIAEQYDSGHLLVSGRQSPPVGGVIIGRADHLAAFRDLLARDPFALNGLVRYDVVEFEPTTAALDTPALKAFIGAGA